MVTQVSEFIKQLIKSNVYSPHVEPEAKNTLYSILIQFPTETAFKAQGFTDLAICH